jgi:hypothetical protein
MDYYSVTIECRADDDRQVTDEQVAALMELIEPHDGVVGGGAGDTAYDATVGVNADDAAAAATEAITLVTRAAAHAGLPGWPIVRVDTVREDILDAELARPDLPDLVSGPEVAGILGVNRQRVHQLAHEHPQFPKPLYRLGVGSLWDRAAIKAFAAGWERKPGRPRRSDAA